MAGASYSLKNMVHKNLLVTVLFLSSLPLQIKYFIHLLQLHVSYSFFDQRLSSCVPPKIR